VRYLLHCIVAVSLAALVAPWPAWADDHQHGMGNFELFLSLQGVTHDGADLRPERREDSWGIADVVFAANRARWRVMGELNLGPNEQDLERFQVGFEPVPDTLVWFGRFHQPGSAWNNELHHGHYLQTAITRPAIEAWEDEEGLVPQHLTGTLLESRRPLGSVAGIQLSLGVGYGSVLDADGLSPIDLLRRNQGAHRLSETARISFLPKYLGSSSAGLLLGRHRTPVFDPTVAATLGAQFVDQDVIGPYLDIDRESWRVVGAVYYIGVGLQGATGERREHFTSGYLQLERRFAHGLTAFLRHENSDNASHARFVAIHADDFVAHGTLGGVRWDFTHRQALTIELSRLTTINATQTAERIQWSTVVP
jgi:hypothetical protein